MSDPAKAAPVRTSEHQVDESGVPVRVRVYHPDSRPVAGLVWIHGGAFSMNDIDVPEAHWVAQRLAAAGIAVVSPDYRLARDGVHFPALTDDCGSAWRWAAGGGAPLAEQPLAWHIGGGSAGGNLAASVAMQARDGVLDAPVPRSTLLVYPALHSPLPAASDELQRKVHRLPPEERYTPEDMAGIDLNYVSDPALLQHPYAFPGHGDLVGMPPALVVNSDHDPLRASGERYAAQLVAAGVDVAVLREPDAHHGHLNFPDQPAAQRTVLRLIEWLSGTALLGATHEPGPERQIRRPIPGSSVPGGQSAKVAASMTNR